MSSASDAQDNLLAPAASNTADGTVNPLLNSSAPLDPNLLGRTGPLTNADNLPDPPPNRVHTLNPIDPAAVTMEARVSELQQTMVMMQQMMNQMVNMMAAGHSGQTLPVTAQFPFQFMANQAPSTTSRADSTPIPPPPGQAPIPHVFEFTENQPSSSQVRQESTQFPLHHLPPMPSSTILPSASRTSALPNVTLGQGKKSIAMAAAPIQPKIDPFVTASGPTPEELFPAGDKTRVHVPDTSIESLLARMQER